MVLKILGGTLKGRSLIFTKKTETRPTQAMVRKSIFDVLGQNIIGAAVLDLFAGSGVVGIEALSRGAASVCFVEQNKNMAHYLRDNLDRLGLLENSHVLVLDVMMALKRIRSHKRSFDFVYIDPPFPVANQVFAAIMNNPDFIACLAQGADIFIELPLVGGRGVDCAEFLYKGIYHKKRRQFSQIALQQFGFFQESN